MLRPTEQLISCEVSRPTMPVHFRRPRIVVGIMLLIGLFSTSAWSACTKITAQSQLAAGDGTASAWAGSLDYNTVYRALLISVPMQTFNPMAHCWQRPPPTSPLSP